ncbi:thiolase domain-containing protein [Mycobacteroides salmoniphilum]|uniref:thiolase domain-containing protein n=1 Tax=Mycobacteroides salmoniphilum TaxID=404941 RepID=UPI000992998D|nr:thiolase domain-containing protein [Mycobacteroides salmoniphilum]QCH22459.1 lipid-transfer protein [Mycobacteroides salmoniphilum]
MRDVAVVSYAQSPCTAANLRDDMAEILLPVVREALEQVELRREDIDFYASGSHDFFEGRTFAYIESLDAVGAWPPISESHVEMDAAWACYEAWAWLQLGHGDIALIYGVGRGAPPADLDQVFPSSLDPYYLAPLHPHRHAIAGLQAAAVIEAGITTEREMADVVNQSLTDALSNPFALKAGAPGVETLLDEPYIAAPLRPHDAAPVGDGAAVLILATGDVARRLARRPAWIRAIDHRMDTHHPGSRDLAVLDSARIAAEKAAAMAGFSASNVEVAELHTEYSYAEPLLTKTFGIDNNTLVNPSGGPLAGAPATATGLIRIGESARTIMQGRATRALAHATNGPGLQHNLVCLMEASA